MGGWLCRAHSLLPVCGELAVPVQVGCYKSPCPLPASCGLGARSCPHPLGVPDALSPSPATSPAPSRHRQKRLGGEGSSIPVPAILRGKMLLQGLLPTRGVCGVRGFGGRKIREWFGLEGTFGGHLAQLPAMSRDVFNWVRLLRAPSNLTLNVLRDGASTTSLGNLCQCFTTCIVKNFFLTPILNLPSFSLETSPLFLSQQALLKSLSPSFLQTPFKY